MMLRPDPAASPLRRHLMVAALCVGGWLPLLLLYGQRVGYTWWATAHGSTPEPAPGWMLVPFLVALVGGWLGSGLLPIHYAGGPRCTWLALWFMGLTTGGFFAYGVVSALVPIRSGMPINDVVAYTLIVGPVPVLWLVSHLLVAFDRPQASGA